MVDKVTFEVENAMQKVDPNLQSHIMRIGVADGK